MENFPDKLSRLLKARGFTQKALMETLGVGKNTVNRWVQGETIPPVETLLRVARSLNVPLEYLVDDEMTEIPQEINAEDRVILGFIHTNQLDTVEVLNRLSKPSRQSER